MRIGSHLMHIQQALLVAVLVIPLSVLTGLLHPRAPTWTEPPLEPGQIGLQTALIWENVLWLDARSRTEYEEAHIPGALLLNEDDWEALFSGLLDVWDPDQKVIVYCGGTQCRKSQQVAERLRGDLGSEEIFVLKGGWSEWSQRN